MKRAISPIIATLILIIVAVVGGTMFYSFASTYVTQLTSYTSRIDMVKIDSAYLMEDQGNPGKQDKVWLAIRNVGREKAYLVDVVMILDTNGSLVTTVTGLSYNPPSALTNGISQGSVVEMYRSGSGLFSLTVGEWYILKIVTTKGGQDEIRVRCVASP